MGVEEAYRSVLSRRVDLPSGGYLMIDYAEALTVIDVNTGSFTGRGKGRLEDTITRVNVEAAEEVVRQLRLRDIGGIIVIDFIDMARARNRDQVLKTLRKALDADKTKSYVMDVSPLGLVEMTRQNVTDGVREILTKRCPTCDGEGVVESEETVAIQVVRRLRDDGRRAAREGGPEAFLVRVNPRVAAELLREDSPLHELEEESGKHFHFEGGEALPLDTFEVVDQGTRAEIEERALPFQVGDEVLVRIEEPHMYNVDDAVARVDSLHRQRHRRRARSSAIDAWCGSRASGARRRPRRWSASRRAARRTRAPQAKLRRRGRRWFRTIAALQTAPRPTRRQAPFPRQGVQTAPNPMATSTSYAIVETGGKQYRAEKGASLVVEHLAADEGAKVSLRAVMYRGDKEVVLDGKELEKVKVEAVVAEHLRGPEGAGLQVQAQEGLPPPRRATARS